jgi:endonuclease YncB( thermonuclease family)
MSIWVWPDAQLLAIIDGDTIEMRVTKDTKVDIGFGGVTEESATFNVRLRLNRINAPAKYTVAGQASMAYLQGMLMVGSTYKLETMKPYKYGGPDNSPGEWMAEITLSDGGNVSDLMVGALMAVYWDGQGPRPADG